MKKYFISACLSLGLIFPQIASGDNNDLSKRIDVLEREIKNIEKSMSNFIENQKVGVKSKDVPQKAIEDLRTDIKNLQFDIERFEVKMKKFSNQNEAFETSANTRINELSESLNKSESGTKTKDSYLISNIAKEIESSDQIDDTIQTTTNQNKAAAAYQKAYVLLKQSGSDKQMQDKALESFMSFIEKFQDSPLRGNAYYWIGSIHSQQKQYSKSAIDFLNGYRANSKSGRAIDNLLGLSDSLIKLNKNKEACAALNKLYNEFPNMNITNKRHTDDMFKNASCSNDD